MTIISRDEARASQLKFYYTGRPCRHGHIANRYTSNNICVECQAISNQRHWHANREELVKQHRTRLNENRDHYNSNRRDKYKEDEAFREQIKQRAKYWYTQNRETVLSDPNYKAKRIMYQVRNKKRLSLSHALWRSNNRQHVNEQSRLYQAQHRSYYTAKQAAYRAQKRLATPPWCEHDSVLAMYERAKQLSHETDVPHHVDHIVPLVHPLVCGLHCLANLQILTERDNKSKNNKHVVG